MGVTGDGLAIFSIERGCADVLFYLIIELRKSRSELSDLFEILLLEKVTTDRRTLLKKQGRVGLVQN
jgi:hypothetical protein